MDTPDTETSPAPHGDHALADASGGDGSVAVQFAPRLLAFYQDVVDDDVASAIGWTTVAWGLAFPDGSALTIPAHGLRYVTLWGSVAEAADALEAYVDTPAPTHRWAGEPAVPAPSDAPAAGPPRALKDTAAQALCPGVVAPAAWDEDRDSPRNHPDAAVNEQAVACPTRPPLSTGRSCDERRCWSARPPHHP
jgi:hypothetical protein